MACELCAQGSLDSASCERGLTKFGFHRSTDTATAGKYFTRDPIPNESDDDCLLTRFTQDETKIHHLYESQSCITALVANVFRPATFDALSRATTTAISWTHLQIPVLNNL